MKQVQSCSPCTEEQVVGFYCCLLEGLCLDLIQKGKIVVGMRLLPASLPAPPWRGDAFWSFSTSIYSSWGIWNCLWTALMAGGRPSTAWHTTKWHHPTDGTAHTYPSQRELHLMWHLRAEWAMPHVIHHITFFKAHSAQLLSNFPSYFSAAFDPWVFLFPLKESASN